MIPNGYLVGRCTVSQKKKVAMSVSKNLMLASARIMFFEEPVGILHLVMNLSNYTTENGLVLTSIKDKGLSV
jgi:hypothetical protein